MSRRRRTAIAAVGLALVAWGSFLAVRAPTGPSLSAPTAVALGLVAMVGLAGALWKVRGRLDSAGDETAVAWDPEGEFARPAPERTDESRPLSSIAFATVVSEAGATARSEGTVADGIAEIRSPLREALLDALSAGDRTRSDARRMVAEGSWTDDDVAAAVLDGSVSPPARTIRERIEAWLYPERVVRRRTRRAMGAVAAAAEDALPTVPGERAPRTVPVTQPTLEDLRRGADGRLQRAVDRPDGRPRAGGRARTDGRALPPERSPQDGQVPDGVRNR